MVNYRPSHSWVQIARSMYHYSELIMGAMAFQITSIMIVYSTVYSGADHRKHQSFASPVNSPHKWPVTRRKFPLDDVIIMDLWHTGFHTPYLFSMNSYVIFIIIWLVHTLWFLVIVQHQCLWPESTWLQEGSCLNNAISRNLHIVLIFFEHVCAGW